MLVNKKAIILDDYNFTFDDIQVINDINEFEKAIDYLIEQDFLAFDGEWSSYKKMDILQIASSKKVYIFQLHQMDLKYREKQKSPKKNQYLNLIRRLAYTILQNKNIKKLAFDFKHDTLNFRNRYSFIQGIQMINNMCDIRYQQYCTYAKGLQDHVQVYLSKFLDKQYQMSEWAKKDLTKEEIQYAALDVIILFPLYKAIKKQLKKQLKFCLYNYERVHQKEEKELDINNMFEELHF